jgi:hypothetical protein
MNRLVTLLRRIFGQRPSAVHPETALGSDGLAQAAQPSADATDLAEFIRTFDLDREKARLTEDNRRLAEENARLWKELIDRNARLDQTAERLRKAEQGLGEAMDREIELIAALLPNIDLLRDSREVLRSGSKDRRSALRLLREISSRPGLVKGEGAENAQGWLEKPFSTGERRTGRIYYRCRGEQCSVLVSLKAEQREDIEYLQTR